MYEIKAYNCDYCKKYSKSKSTMKRHEKECFHNPAMNACATCAHLTYEAYKVDKSHVLGDFQGDVYDSAPKCVAGKVISNIDAGRKSVNLQSHCDCWIGCTQNEEEIL